MVVIRILAKTVIVLVALVFFTCFAAILHVRGAIADGALNETHICLSESHFDWREGNYPAGRVTWLSANQVRHHYLGNARARMSEWHLRGAFAGLGVWLGYSADTRQRMAEQVIAAMPDCPPRNH